MATDKELIKRWRTKRDQAAYDELARRHKNMVYHRSNMYRASPVPQPALEAQAWQHFDDAVNNYDLNSPAKFSTYLSYSVRKVDRYNKSHQNIARMPEELAYKIGDYNTALNNLQIKHNRQPTQAEISKHMGVKKSVVKRLETGLRQDLFQGQFKGEQDDPDAIADNAESLMRDIRHEFTPQEREVYDALTGFGGKKPVTNKSVLARRLGMSPGRLSQITGSIAKKMKPHLHKI